MNKILRTVLLLLGSTSVAFASPQSFSNCDINRDGTTNALDVQAIINEALGITPAVHDLNVDASVNVLDIQIVINAALGGACTADTGSVTPPGITGFSPTSGPIGTQVTVTGTNFGSSLTISMPKQGGGTIAQPLSTAASNSLTFVLAAGTATGPITIANGAAAAFSSSSFTVTPSSTFTLTAAPGSATLIQGQSVTYAVQVNSTSGFNQSAALSVTGAPGGVTASLNPAAITAGQTSVLTLTAPSTQPIATSNLSIMASATISGIPVTQTAPLSLVVVAPTTTFLGRTVVSDTVETPLAGVKVTTLGFDGAGNTTGCTGHTTVSDAAGNFALTNLPATCIGPQLIGFDGTTVTSPAGTYAGVDLVFTLVSGQVVVSPVLVHMPRIDTAETFMAQQNSTVDQSYVFKSIPGLSVTVYAGTVFTEADGTKPNPFPLTAIVVPVDRLPDQMPLTNSMVTAFIVAFQPANTVANKAVAVWFPNTLNTPPGTDVPLMTLDPTRGRMVAYGTGTVSNDGTTIIPDVDPSTGSLQHRFGIVHFDWHGPAVNPPPTINPPCGCGNAESGGPIDLSSGVDVLTSQDLVLHGNRGSVSIARTYRTLSTQLRAFGIGSSFNYDYRLDVLTPQSAAVVNLELPNGVRVPFNLQPGGTLVNTTAPPMSGAVMTTASNGTATLRFKSGAFFTFAPGTFITGSVLTGIGDANGNVITIVRNPSIPQQITEIDDPAGRKLILTWNANNNITSITDPIGRVVSYTYNSAGTLATFTNVLGGVTTYTYDSQNRLFTVTDPRGVVLEQNAYDANGRVVSQVTPSSGTIGFAYTLTNTLVPTSPVVQTVVTDPLGKKTTYRFNTQGYVVSATDASGQTRTLNRASGTNLVLSMTGSGTCEVCGDTMHGDVTFTYDASGNVLTRTDSLGNAWGFAYDPIFNNVTSVTDPSGKVTKRAYDAHGNLIKITDARGNNTLLTRNGTGLMTAAQDAAGNITKFTYDSLGNLVSVLNALNQKTQFSYDGASRLVGQMDPLGRTSTVNYNTGDEAISLVDGNGHTVQFAYDTAGFVLSYTDPNGGKTAVAYDKAGRIASKTDPLKRVKTYQYDVDNNLTGFTNRRGQPAVYAYDSLNRVATETYIDATVQRTYDSNSRLIRVVDSQSGTFDLTYDTAGRLTKVAGPNGTISYTRDANGRVVSRQVQGQAATAYTYDPNGNLAGIAMAGTSVTRTYDARNLLTANMRSNGVAGSYGYDAVGRILSITEKASSNTLFSRAFTYDSAGQITGNAVDTGLALQTPSATGVFDAANEVTTFGTTTYTSDADGNRLTEVSAAGTTSYTWDSRGRLQAILAPGGLSSSFVYDPGGQMIQKQVTGAGQSALEKYVLDDALNIVSVQQGTSPVTSVMDGRGPDDIAATVQSGSQMFPLLDQLGSEGAFTDGSGNVIGREFFEPYGAGTGTGTTGMFLFAGRPQISGNIYYDRARFYDSGTSRFISEDPLAVSGTSTNFYAYVAGNPVRAVDPTGEFWWIVGGAIIGGGGDLIYQLIENGGHLGCVDWSEVGGWALGGAGLGALASAYAIPATLYHFTSLEAAASIAGTGIEAGSGLFGTGVYASSVNSGVAATLMGAASTETSIAFSTEGLTIARTLIPGAFRVIGNVPVSSFLLQ